MEGMQPGASAAARPVPFHRRRWPFLILAVLPVVVVLIVVLATLPSTPTSPPNGAPIRFGLSGVSGNESAGWTYSVRVYVTLSWERPRPIVWGNLNIGFLNSTDGRRLLLPSGATLRALSPSNFTLAEYDFAQAVWREGFFALVEEGQTLVLHGMIPPGQFVQTGTAGSVTGSSLSIAYANDGHLDTIYLALTRDVTVFLALARD